MKTKIEIRDPAVTDQVFSTFCDFADSVPVPAFNCGLLLESSRPVIILEGSPATVKAAIKSVNWTGIDYGIEALVGGPI